MPLKTLVKVGKITNLSDARYCAGMNVDMLGFVTVQSQENYLSVKDYQDIRGWVSGPKVVAEVYGVKTTEELSSILENYRPDYLELSTQELGLVQNTLPILLRLKETEMIPTSTRENIYAVITQNRNTKKGAHGKSILVLFDGADTEMNDDLLNTSTVDGIVLSGSKEDSPGLKDYDHLAEVLENLEVE
jgi:phosphoribosylanthranilate isomerase